MTPRRSTPASVSSLAAGGGEDAASDLGVQLVDGEVGSLVEPVEGLG